MCQVPWSGVLTKYSTSPFAEEMFEKMILMLAEYEVVINRWPEYTLILENVSTITVLLVVQVNTNSLTTSF